jgi:hypothetical protein
MNKFIVASFFCFALFFSTANAQCSGCEMLVSAIEGWVEQNATVAEITQYLDQLCALVPGIGPVCTQFVNYGIEYVVAYINQNENPQQICTQMGFCTAQEQQLEGADCAICEQVIGTMEGWLASNAGQAEVETLLDTLCKLVPAFDSVCEAIVSAGVPTVINWIDTYENSTIVCGQLSLCSADQKKPVVPAGGLDCEACKVVIDAIERWLGENKTEVAIETDLENLFCSFVGKFTKTCDAVFEAGIPEVIVWIQTYENSAVVCQQLTLCSSTKPQLVVAPLLRLF